MTAIDEPDWEPENPSEKVVLPEPVLFFTVTTVSDDESGLGWKYIGKCNPRATCCGSRAELRFLGGDSRVVRIGGITGASIIVSAPRPVGDIPVGTEVWLLETEETDYAALVHGDTTPLPLWTPIKNPVDRVYRRQIRSEVDAQLAALPFSAACQMLAQCRAEHPVLLSDGSWVVYHLPDGRRALYLPDSGSYLMVTLENNRSCFENLGAVVEHLRGM